MTLRQDDAAMINVDEVDREYKDLRARLKAALLFAAPIEDLYAYLLRDLEAYPAEREAYWNVFALI